MLSKRLVVIIKPIVAFGGLMALLQLEWMLEFYYPAIASTYAALIPVTAIAGGFVASWTLPRRHRRRPEQVEEAIWAGEQAREEFESSWPLHRRKRDKKVKPQEEHENHQ